MTRHTTFRFCLDPTVEQTALLSQHAGAARFAFNQTLQIVKESLDAKNREPQAKVPWTGFDLINAFNAWKKTEAAGRIFIVGSDGTTAVSVTGLHWRTQVCQQVFEEAAVDLSRALSSWLVSRNKTSETTRIGFPKFKKKGQTNPSFRLRCRKPKVGPPTIRVGDHHPRAVTLPGIGAVRVHDDTRRLRRLIRSNRARIMFATLTLRGGRWWVNLTIAAASLHGASQHAPRADGDTRGWVGVDLGLLVFAVGATADGHELFKITEPPRALAIGTARERRLSKSWARKQRGSANQRRAAARLARHHRTIRNTRHHFLHQVSNQLVKTHDRLALEDLNIGGLLRNRRLARSISDAAWAEFARMLVYKQSWRNGQVVFVDQWYPSSKTCANCGSVKTTMPLSNRIFACEVCGTSRDRDLNAAINLAVWAERAQSQDLETRGLVTNARRWEGTGPRNRAGETGPSEAGTEGHSATAG